MLGVPGLGPRSKYYDLATLGASEVSGARVLVIGTQMRGRRGRILFICTLSPLVQDCPDSISNILLYCTGY